MASEAYTQRWANLFNLLDQSKNGLIGAGDVPFFEKKLRASGAFTEVQITEILAAVDSVIDGALAAVGGSDKKVNKDEFTALSLKWLGKPFSSAPAWVTKAAGKFFDVVDANKNGELTQKEVIALATQVYPAAPVDAIKEEFKKLGGKLTKVNGQELAWNWLTSNEAQSEDIYLALVLSQINAQ